MQRRQVWPSAEAAVSEPAGCAACAARSVQPLSGQESCTACTAGAGTADFINCYCDAGYSRACSGEADQAIVTGLPEGDGTYSLLKTVMGKPVFSATIASGTETAEWVIAYNLTFKEWQIYEKQASGQEVDAATNISTTTFTKNFKYFFYGRLADTPFPPSGEWLYEPDPKLLATTISNIVIDCNKVCGMQPSSPIRYCFLISCPFLVSSYLPQFECSICAPDTFNQLPSAATCQQCPINMDTKLKEGTAGRRQCTCRAGYVGSCSSDLEVSGHTNSFFNGIYSVTKPSDWTLQMTFPHKPYYKAAYFDLFFGEDTVKAKDPVTKAVIPCAGRWYFGEIKMSNKTNCPNCKQAQSSKYVFKTTCDSKDKPTQSKLDSLAEAREVKGETCMTVKQRSNMKYTMMSACTDSAVPPSGPGWKDHRTSVGLNLLQVDCRSDTSCELW